MSRKVGADDYNLSRENWKNRYYWVLRVKGRVVSRRKASKSFNKYEAFNQVKRTKSLYSTISREKLTNVSEITITTHIQEGVDGKLTTVARFRGRKPKRKYQAFAIIRYQGNSITATSQGYDYDYPFKDALKEAVDSVMERLAQRFGKKYDADEGLTQFFELQGATLETGIKYYR